MVLPTFCVFLWINFGFKGVTVCCLCVYRVLTYKCPNAILGLVLLSVFLFAV